MSQHWKKEEIDKLKYFYCTKGLSAIEIAPLLNRTIVSVHLKQKRLKLHHTTEQTSQIKSRINLGSRNGMYGKIGANKGLTKETSERIKIAAQKLSIIKKDQFARGVINVSGEKNGMYGKIPWSKGLTKETSEIILNAALKQSKTRKEMWKKLPEEEKNRKRKLWASQGLKCPKKDTSIEKIIKKTLDDLNVKHERNYPLDRWFVDFYLENGKVVECFGDYWHCNPKRYSDLSKISIAQKNNIKRDREKLEFLTKNKISYLVLWEDEINNGIGLKKLKLFI